MEKVRFRRDFEYALYGYISLKIFWNFYVFSTGEIKALMPILLQGILLYLIYSKNKYAKLGIKIWAVILILSYGMQFFAKILKVTLGDEIEFSTIANKAVFMTFGILMYIFNEKYVDIIKQK